MPGLLPSRRAFLGGLLTLAVAPALATAPSGLTPLERTVEAVRAVRLDYLLGRASLLNIIHSIRPLHAAPITREQRHQLVRLAFLMARRDFKLELHRMLASGAYEPILLGVAVAASSAAARLALPAA